MTLSGNGMEVLAASTLEWGKLWPDLDQPQMADYAILAIFALFLLGVITTGWRILHLQMEGSELNKVRESEPDHDSLEEYADGEGNNHTIQRIRALVNLSHRRHEPSLSELRQNSQFYENGHISVGVSHAMASILIICGIAGTVLGIHGLNFSDNLLEKLPEALRPSFWAVIGTILLILLRFIYQHRFTNFLNALDGVTRNQFIGEFDFDGGFKKSLEKFRDSIDPLREVAIQINENMLAWGDTFEKYRQSGKEMQEAAAELTGMIRTFGKTMTKQNEYFESVKHILVEVPDMQNKVLECMTGVYTSLGQFQEKDMQFGQAISVATSELANISQVHQYFQMELMQLRAGAEQLSQIVPVLDIKMDHAGKALAENSRLFTETITQSHHSAQKMNDALGGIDTVLVPLHEKINVFANSMTDSMQATTKTLTETAQLLQKTVQTLVKVVGTDVSDELPSYSGD